MMSVLLCAGFAYPAPPSSTDVDRAIESFDEILEVFFRGPSRNERVDLVNREVDVFNEWIVHENERIDAERLEVEDYFQSMEQVRLRIEQMDGELGRTPDRGDTSAIRVYNDIVADRNRIVARYTEMSVFYTEMLDSYRLATERFETESDEMRRRVGIRKSAMEEWTDSYDTWIESGGDETFHHGLNRLFAALCTERRSAGRTDRLEEAIDKIRRMRDELGEWSAEQEKRMENGLIILPARMGGSETCWFILDTGASLVSLSPEMVDALGWGDLQGDVVESSVAGGLTVSGRTIEIPKIEMLGVSAEGVDGKVLRESHVGVDGLLGRSFLKQFRLIVEEGVGGDVRLERVR